jgi:hypothetical protein
MITWEYLETHAALAGRKELGREGWELVAVTVTPDSLGRPLHTFHFKRRKAKRAARKR